MNLLIALSDKWLSLPVWAWIIIAAVVVVAIIVIAVVSAKIVRAKKRMRGEQAARPVSHTAESEAAPAAQPAPAPAAQPKPAPAPAPAAQGEQKEQAKVYHITKRASDGKWQVKFNKGKKAIKLFETQAEAIEFAKRLAVNQEASIMIHKEDGSFRRLRYDKSTK